jgi:hypothetical protein
MTYANFDRKYIICPEETLAVYGLLKEVDVIKIYNKKCKKSHLIV